MMIEGGEAKMGGTIGEVLPFCIAGKLHVAECERVQMRLGVSTSNFGVEGNFQRCNGCQKWLLFQRRWPS